MRTPRVTTCLSAALCVALAAAGCATKGVQATAQDELTQAGQSDGGAGADVAGRGMGQSGMSEQDLAGGPGGMGSSQRGEPDFGTRGFGEGESFESSDIPGFSGGLGERELGMGGGQPGTGGQPGMGGHPGMGDQPGMEGAREFGGPGGYDPSMGAQGEEGGLGSFPEMGGSGSAEGAEPAFGGFGSVESGQMPPEDRVGEETMIAKADASEAFESQMEGMHDDRLSSAAGELEDVFFGYDSWSISEQAKTALSESATWLKENPSMSLTVEGHADKRGSSSYNLVLGEKRAKAVRDYLIELGVSPARVRAVSYGEERPFCEESSEACYQLNRRGHLVAR